VRRRLCPALLLLFVISLIAPPAAAQENWRTFSVPEFGTRVEFPAGLFSESEGAPQRGSGQRFRTADGQAQLSIYALRREGLTPAGYLRANLQVPRQSLYYQRIAPNFFAISARHGDMIYYSRCNFGSEAIHCVYVIYPGDQKRAFDSVVTRISRTLRPL